MTSRLILATCALAMCCSVKAAETTTYTYDAQGRLIKTLKTGGLVAGQQKCTDYDPAGNRTTRIVTFSGCTSGSGGGGGTAPVFTINDPPGNFEGSSIVFTVTKTGAGAASINFASANGSATAGSDYGAVSGTLNFASGDASKTITVVTYTDFINEGTETFVVNLSNATGGATISDAQGTGTIYNDDSGSCSPICQ